MAKEIKKKGPDEVKFRGIITNQKRDRNGILKNYGIRIYIESQKEPIGDIAIAENLGYAKDVIMNEAFQKLMWGHIRNYRGKFPQVKNRNHRMILEQYAEEKANFAPRQEIKYHFLPRYPYDHHSTSYVLTAGKSDIREGEKRKTDRQLNFHNIINSIDDIIEVKTK